MSNPKSNISDRIIRRFDQIWRRADKVNREEGWPTSPRFHRLWHEESGRLHSVGIYDFHTKKHVIFEMINTVGNKDMPAELREMDQMVSNASS